jgi:hypothetical protein
MGFIVFVVSNRPMPLEERRLLAAGVDPMARRMATNTASQERGTTFEAMAALRMEH